MSLTRAAQRMADSVAADAIAKTYAAGTERADVLNAVALILNERATQIRAAKIEKEYPQIKEDQ